MQPPRRKLITPKRFLAAAVQVALFAALLWLVHGIAENVVANLKARNIASGFGFLDQPAGFSIIQTLIPYRDPSAMAALSSSGC